jgi:zinc ribbon protein
VRCPNCGTLNPADATRCANCGAPLMPDATRDAPTIIDVTEREPHVVPANADDERAWPYTFSTRQWEWSPGRVVTVRGGRWTCLTVGVVLVLLLCCSCWAVGQLLGNPGGFFSINGH